MRSSETLKKNEKEILCDKLFSAAEKTVLFLESKLQQTGSYGDDIQDIACYFKSPMLFIKANKPKVACKILHYIQNHFICTNGDFKSSDTMKSLNTAYVEYWSYVNGWIIRAANYLGFTELSNLSYKYFSQYNLGDQKGFITNEINEKTRVTDVLTTAHHGLVNLEMGNIEIAKASGKYLCNALLNQPNLQKGFFLRFNEEGRVLTKFTDKESLLYFINTKEPNQLYFMIGYPCAYLAILSKETGDESFLTTAKSYMDFILSCNENIYYCDFSHKIAWAASAIYQCTEDAKYLNIIEKISDYFILKQKGGMWNFNDTLSSYDQSSEIACWFLDIAKNIENVKKKEIKLEEKLSNSGLKSFSIYNADELKNKEISKMNNSLNQLTIG